MLVSHAESPLNPTFTQAAQGSPPAGALTAAVVRSTVRSSYTWVLFKNAEKAIVTFSRCCPNVRPVPAVDWFENTTTDPILAVVLLVTSSTSPRIEIDPDAWLQPDRPHVEFSEAFQDITQ